MKNGRSRVWIDPFQSKLVLRVVYYSAISMFTLWNFLFGCRLLQQGRGDLWQQYQSFFFDYYPIFFCFALLMPFFAWDAIRMAHPLVGPLGRFRRSMQAIQAGEPVQPIKLRDGDYLGDMKDAFNGMLEALQKRGQIPAASESKAHEPRTGTLNPKVTERAS